MSLLFVTLQKVDLARFWEGIAYTPVAIYAPAPKTPPQNELGSGSDDHLRRCRHSKFVVGRSSAVNITIIKNILTLMSLYSSSLRKRNAQAVEISVIVS